MNKTIGSNVFNMCVVVLMMTIIKRSLGGDAAVAGIRSSDRWGGVNFSFVGRGDVLCYVRCSSTDTTSVTVWLLYPCRLALKNMSSDASQ